MLITAVAPKDARDATMLIWLFKDLCHHPEGWRQGLIFHENAKVVE
jgi:hypothetical protein